MCKGTWKACHVSPSSGPHVLAASGFSWKRDCRGFTLLRIGGWLRWMDALTQSLAMPMPPCPPTTAASSSVVFADLFFPKPQHRRLGVRRKERANPGRRILRRDPGEETWATRVVRLAQHSVVDQAQHHQRGQWGHPLAARGSQCPLSLSPARTRAAPEPGQGQQGMLKKSRPWTWEAMEMGEMGRHEGRHGGRHGHGTPGPPSVRPRPRAWGRTNRRWCFIVTPLTADARHGCPVLPSWPKLKMRRPQRLLTV